MALEKQSIVDKIEVIENGSVQVRTSVRVVDAGVLISSSLHRHVVAPGDDYSNEDARVKAICSAIHTPEVIAAYASALVAAQSQLSPEGA